MRPPRVRLWVLMAFIAISAVGIDIVLAFLETTGDGRVFLVTALLKTSLYVGLLVLWALWVRAGIKPKSPDGGRPPVSHVAIRVLMPFFALGIWLLVTHGARAQRRAAAAIRSSGGEFYYDYQISYNYLYIGEGRGPVRPPREPDWLRTALGDDLFHDVAEVHLRRDADMESLKYLNRFRNLRVLSLSDSGVDDALSRRIQDLQELRKLFLYGTLVTDAGISRLRRLDRLVLLNLAETRVSNAGLSNLKSMHRLRWLYVYRTRVDAVGVKDLKKSLPDVTVVWTDRSGNVHED